MMSKYFTLSGCVASYFIMLFLRIPVLSGSYLFKDKTPFTPLYLTWTAARLSRFKPYLNFIMLYSEIHPIPSEKFLSLLLGIIMSYCSLKFISDASKLQDEPKFWPILAAFNAGLLSFLSSKSPINFRISSLFIVLISLL